MKCRIICLPLAAVASVLFMTAGPPAPPALAQADTVTEIHYSFGNTPGTVWFDWDGQPQDIYYGPDAGYGMSAIASSPNVTPVDSAGPFRQVQLTGLAPGATYHYKIGATGLDHIFRTVPDGDFTWVDIGDTASTLCDPWVAGIHALVAAQNPWFVTHGGDIAEANVCGVAAVHQYYVDQQVWSDSAAFQPVWGNHEYGMPTGDAPPGTPRDSLLNYKGRSFITNGQPVPSDTASRTTNPGCGWETGAAANTCQGNDWGWFTAGHVLFISYPEPWPGAYPAWQASADVVMAAAQADPGIDFIVTYGHRPAYSSVSSMVKTELRTALDNLAAKYSPTASRPDGKFVLSVNHDVHMEEVFKPINGLVNITNGGGGSGQVNPATFDPDSLWHIVHPAILSASYSAVSHSLAVSLLCGPAYAPNPKTTCTYGSVLYHQTFTRPGTSVPHEWVGNQSVESDMSGWTGKYGGSPYVTVTHDNGAAHSGSYSLKVTALAGASNLSSGFNDSPRWVQATTGGATYTQTAWVKPAFAGQTIVMRLREWSGSTLVTDRYVTFTAATTGWQQLTQTLTAAGSNHQLAFAIYGKGMSAGQSFYADDFSLTTRR